MQRRFAGEQETAPLATALVLIDRYLHASGGATYLPLVSDARYWDDVPSQMASGRSPCFCGTLIDIKGVDQQPSKLT